MRWFIISVCWCSVLTLRGQDDIAVTPPVDTRDSLRSVSIKSFPDYFFSYPVMKQRSLAFELEKTDGSAVLSYKPNNSFSLGLGVYLFEVGIDITFAIPLDEKSKYIYGDSDTRDFHCNLLGKKWGGDAFYQKYTGFYITENNQTPPPDIPYAQRLDIESRNLGVNCFYVFNHQKFSFRAVYNFSERQLYSNGSFMLSSSLSRFSVSGDSSIITEDQKVIFGDQVAFEELRYASFSLAPGYTYSLIFKNFFLNGALSIGPAHHWIRYKLENSNDQNDIGINAFVAARIGIGFNGDRIFGGISFITQGSNVKFEGVQFSNNISTFRIALGYRFRERGLLKKRAWDIVPIKV